MKQRILVNDTHPIEMSEGVFDSFIIWCNQNLDGTFEVRDMRRKVPWEAEDRVAIQARLDESVANDRATAAAAADESARAQEAALEKRLAEVQANREASAGKMADADREAKKKASAAKKANKAVAAAKAKQIIDSA